jgi:hypothetical protein
MVAVDLPANSDVANGIVRAGTGGSHLDVWIDDEQFICDLGRLKDLRSFLIQETVLTGDAESSALSFGQLNQLRFRGNGRAPTEEEWTAVERHTQLLFALLTLSLRRRFVLGGLPSAIAWLPICFAAVALVSLLLAVVAGRIDVFGFRSITGNVFPFYLVWLMSLGAIGSIAFIGMNALSVQEDATFDLTNSRLMALRISLGALFALVLTLPTDGFNSFVTFCSQILHPGETPASSSAGQLGLSISALLLLLPFILGFSTSLVILVLNQLLEGVQSFFGRPSSRSSASVPVGTSGTPATPAPGA